VVDPLRALLPLLLRSGPGDLPTPTEGADEARRRAEQILARPELRPADRTLLQQFFDIIGRAFRRLLEAAGAGSGLVAWIVMVCVAAAVALVLFLVIRTLARDPVIERGVEVDRVGRPATEWRTEAAHHEAAGAWRDALRCHWRALVADLAARGLVEEVPGRTTGEYRRLVADTVPGAATTFSGATGLFELAWYAASDVHEADVAEQRRLGAEVLAEAGR
jgi:hypothetical protein